MTDKKRKYYLAETYEDTIQTASIVRKDNEKILAQEGFAALKFQHIKDGSIVIKIRRLAEIVKIASSIKEGDIVVFHFPLLAGAYKILLKLLNKKGVKTVALIIDIDGLRYNNPELLQQEMNMLHSFNSLITHNAAMKSFVSQYISSDKIFCIELFDYPVPEKIPVRSLAQPVCFAGNFEKAAFVHQLYKVENIDFNLYGPSFTAHEQKNVFYKGSFPSHELPGIVEGSFGLVWDGASINSCDDYLQYNNPYKLSLYIAAGLPLIVWEKSAVAEFVLQNNIGFSVGSLHDIETVIKNLPASQYELMQQNIIPIREKMAKGYFLKSVLRQLPF